MSISFADLRVLMIPKLKSCPPQIINQRLSWSARRFLNRSEIWRHDQNQSIVAFQTAYPLTLPSTNAEPKRLAGLWYGSDSINQAALRSVEQEDYNLNLSQTYVLMAGSTSPDITGRYYDTGKVYNSNAVYQFGSTPFYIWNDSSNWILSLTIGTKDNYFTAASLTATWTAAGTYTGAPTSTTASELTVGFINAYTAALEFGLTTTLVCIPDLAATDEIPGELMDEWGVRGFMELALEDLKGDQDQPWSDSDGSKAHKTMADRAIAEARNPRNVNRKSGSLRVTPRYFA